MITTSLKGYCTFNILQLCSFNIQVSSENVSVCFFFFHLRQVLCKSAAKNKRVLTLNLESLGKGKPRLRQPQNAAGQGTRTTVLSKSKMSLKYLANQHFPPSLALLTIFLGGNMEKWRHDQTWQVAFSNRTCFNTRFGEYDGS